MVQVVVVVWQDFDRVASGQVQKMLDRVYTVMYDDSPPPGGSSSSNAAAQLVNECRDWTSVFPHMWCVTKVKAVARTRLPSVGFRSRSRFLAVSLQVT